MNPQRGLASVNGRPNREPTPTGSPPVDPADSPTLILTINGGSSSLKAGLFQMADRETRIVSATIERIGQSDSRMHIKDGNDTVLMDREGAIADHGAALMALVGWLRDHGFDRGLRAVGHRIVYGGHRFRTPQRITLALQAALRELAPMDLDHLPQACANIETIGRLYPALMQVACFDTAFHRHMPPVAQHYALPERFAEMGIMRLGFHGLSYESVMHTLRACDPKAAHGRVVIAHLGSGASMAAIRDGHSIDTSMGFTPLAGLVMGTRCGDLDPGIVLHLLTGQGMTPAAVNDLLNKESGLLGVSATSSDMRDLLERERTDVRAALAIAMFCYQARKTLGSYAAALGGLDTLIFTAGIGAGAAPIRARICQGLAFLGIVLDDTRNDKHAPIISAEASPVTVRVIPTDEDRMIARHTQSLITLKEGASYVHV